MRQDHAIADSTPGGNQLTPPPDNVLGKTGNGPQLNRAPGFQEGYCQNPLISVRVGPDRSDPPPAGSGRALKESPPIFSSIDWFGDGDPPIRPSATVWAGPLPGHHGAAEGPVGAAAATPDAPPTQQPRQRFFFAGNSTKGLPCRTGGYTNTRSLIRMNEAVFLQLLLAT